VVQAQARLPPPHPRKDAHGGIDFRIQHQIKAYKKDAAPTLRVKPVPIIVIIFIVAQAYGNTREVAEMAIANMIVIACFFLLRPGEYTNTLADDATFKIEDISLCVQGCKLDFSMASDAEIKASTSASYTFTTQKNNNHNEKVVQGLTSDPCCCMHCPVHIILSRQYKNLGQSQGRHGSPLH
jgi:hypothetical protein